MQQKLIPLKELIRVLLEQAQYNTEAPVMACWDENENPAVALAGKKAILKVQVSFEEMLEVQTMPVVANDWGFGRIN